MSVCKFAYILSVLTSNKIGILAKLLNSRYLRTVRERFGATRRRRFKFVPKDVTCDLYSAHVVQRRRLVVTRLKLGRKHTGREHAALCKDDHRYKIAFADSENEGKTTDVYDLRLSRSIKQFSPTKEEEEERELQSMAVYGIKEMAIDQQQMTAQEATFHINGKDNNCYQILRFILIFMLPYHQLASVLPSTSPLQQLYLVLRIPKTLLDRSDNVISSKCSLVGNIHSFSIYMLMWNIRSLVFPPRYCNFHPFVDLLQSNKISAVNNIQSALSLLELVNFDFQISTFILYKGSLVGEICSSNIKLLCLHVPGSILDLENPEFGLPTQAYNLFFYKNNTVTEENFWISAPIICGRQNVGPPL
ncbi:hypothetical protein C0J52_19631 [Blattella germanica]|nr:hypothetical protein C0J52_19631 [Blattella germanica]